MVLIIPLLAFILGISGVLLNAWYYTLSPEKREEYDWKTLQVFKMNLFQRFNIKLDDSDGPREVEQKAKEKGVPPQEIERAIKDAANRASQEI